MSPVLARTAAIGGQQRSGRRSFIYSVLRGCARVHVVDSLRGDAAPSTATAVVVVVASVIPDDAYGEPDINR
jgi:hypothetical protein